MGKRKNHNNLQVAAAPALNTINAAKHQPAPIEVSRNEKLLRMISKTTVRIFGVLLIGAGATSYFQLLPLLFIFAGGYLGVQPSAGIAEMDTMIWLLTCVGILIPMVYMFLKGVKYIWVRFVVNPFPLFPFVRKPTKRA